MSVYDGYRSVLATDALKYPVDWTFKSNPIYQRILEHVTPEQGHEYLKLAMTHPRWTTRFMERVCETALENDRYGKPVKADFDELGITCSPTNFRYLWHAMSIWDHANRCHIMHPRFVEIGGGYGGLHLWLSKLGQFDYGAYDLSEALVIQKAYAALHGLKVLSPETMGGNLFLVSAYALSELEPPIQRWYMENVLPRCSRGWLLWNTELPAIEGWHAEDEVPQTGAINKTVTF